MSLWGDACEACMCEHRAGGGRQRLMIGGDSSGKKGGKGRGGHRDPRGATEEAEFTLLSSFPPFLQLLTKVTSCHNWVTLLYHLFL